MAIINCGDSTLDTENLPGVLTADEIICLQEWATLPENEAEVPEPPSQEEIDEMNAETLRVERKVARWIASTGGDDEVIEYIIGYLPSIEYAPLQIDYREFPRMGESKQEALAEAGVTLVNQLYNLGAQAIDDLPISGIGTVTAQAWYERSKELLNDRI